MVALFGCDNLQILQYYFDFFQALLLIHFQHKSIMEYV